MKRATARCAWTVFIALLDYAHASACSGPPPRSDQLMWHDGAVTALLAPTASIVRVGPGISRPLGSLRWTARDHAVLQTDSTALVFQPVYDDPPVGCSPMSLRLLHAATGTARCRPVLALPTGAYVGDLLLSPDRERVAIELSPELDDEPTYFAIIDAATDRVVGMITGDQLGWLSDDHVVVVNHAGDEAAVWSVDGAAPQRIGDPRESPGGGLSVVPDSSGPAVLFESGTLTTAAVRGSTIEWSSESTSLGFAPALISRAAGVALFFDWRRSRVVLRSIETAELVQRYAGQGHYGAAAFSPDGDYLALIGHAPHEIESDGDSPLDGAATVEVFRLRDGARWDRGDRARTVLGIETPSAGTP